MWPKKLILQAVSFGFVTLIVINEDNMKFFLMFPKNKGLKHSFLRSVIKKIYVNEKVILQAVSFGFVTLFVISEDNMKFFFYVSYKARPKALFFAKRNKKYLCGRKSHFASCFFWLFDPYCN